MKYLRTEREDQMHEGRPVYAIVNKRSGATIGQAFWYRPWKQYTARFREDSVWSFDCLEGVAAFLTELNTGGHAGLRGTGE